jgi:hypothetical protein
VCNLDTGRVRLLGAEESLDFEKRLFDSTRSGFADGTIRRRVEVTGGELGRVIADALGALSLRDTIVAPVKSMEFAFAVESTPNPEQLRRLVLLDGDSVFVVSPDLQRGMGIDLYESETRSGMCFEVSVWPPAIPGARRTGG